MTEYSTAGHVSSSIDVQIVPALGSRKLNSATPSVVEQFLDEHHRRHRPLPVTIRPRTPTARSRNLRTHQPCCRRYTSMMPDDLGGSLCSRLCTASWPGIGPDLGSALGFPGHGMPTSAAARFLASRRRPARGARLRVQAYPAPCRRWSAHPRTAPSEPTNSSITSRSCRGVGAERRARAGPGTVEHW